MARRRLISPEFFLHSALFDAEAATGLPLRLAFAGLWCQADREGRFRWRPRELKLSILPYDTVDFAAVMEALATWGFLERYIVDGEALGTIPSFAKWQTFHKAERPSTIQAPCLDAVTPSKHRTKMPVTVTVSSTGTVNDRPPTAGVSEPHTEPAKHPPALPAGKRPDPLALPPLFVEAWAAYPKAAGSSKADALRQWRKRVASGARPEEMLDGTLRYAAYVAATGTTYVKHAQTFFGPGCHWEADWTPPATPAEREDAAIVAETSGFAV